MIPIEDITIIIPAHNGLEYSRICIESLLRHTPHGFRLVLVDNGSHDGTADFFHSIAGAVVVRHKENLGFAAGINAGLRHATAHALILNNDTYLSPGWIEPMLEALASHKKVGIVGPVSNHVSGPQLVDGLSLTTTDAIDAFAASRLAGFHGQTRNVERLVGFCMVIRDTVLADAGHFDERFGLGNFEDDDYCRRTLDAGYQLLIADASFVYHFGHRTFLALSFTGDDFDQLLAENARKYATKWRLRLEETGYPQSRALYLHDEGLALKDAGKFDAALTALVESVKTFPGFALGHNDLGAVLWQMGEHDRAYGCFERAVRLCPGYTEARDNLRDAAVFLGREERLARILEDIDGH